MFTTTPLALHVLKTIVYTIYRYIPFVGYAFCAKRFIKMEISHNLPNSLVDIVNNMSGFISHKRFSFTIRENVEFILLFFDLLNF